MDLKQIHPLLIGILAASLAPMPAAAAPPLAPLATIAGVSITAAIAALVGTLWLWRRLVAARQEGARLRRRAQHFEALAASAPAAFCAWGPGGGDESLGPNISHLLGATGGGLKTFADIVAFLDAEDRERLQTTVAALHGEGRGFELTLKRGQKTFEVTGSRSLGRDGRPIADMVWFHDVTMASSQVARLTDSVAAVMAERDRFAGLLDSVEVPIWLRDGKLNLIECNRAYGTAVDAASSADAIAGQKEIASGPTGWGRKLAERARDLKEPQNDSLHVVVGGSRRLLEITELPLPDSDLIAGFCLDRTAREQAEDEITRHLAAHGEVLERLGTAIIIFGPDSRVQFVNSTYAKLWELDEGWLRTGPTQGEILEELRAHRRLPEQVDFQAYKKSLAELYTTLIEPLEELLHLPDERVMRMVVNPHPFGGLLFTFEDVTDRLTLERSYNTLIAVQRESLNNLHEAVAVFGSDGRLKLYNPAYQRIWNFTPKILEGEPRVSEVLESAKGLFDYGDDWEGFKEKAVSRATDHRPHAGRFGRTDGTVLDYASIPLPDGAVLYSYIDVTDSLKIERALRERNEALETADRLKSEFIANVSYELRTPLNSIIGFTEILLNQYYGTLNERQLDHAQSVVESSQVLLTLIDDILDLAMIEAGRLALDLKPVDVYDMMSGVLNYGRERASKQDVALKLKCPKTIGEIVADGQRLRQALFNLVSNSLEHTPEKGTITMSARRDGDHIIFAVADTGRGIDKELQERVFDKFEHGRRGVAPSPGVGLGLSLVKSFIELHGGTVELASKSGKGTTITCRLPVVVHQQTEVSAPGNP